MNSRDVEAMAGQANLTSFANNSSMSEDLPITSNNQEDFHDKTHEIVHVPSRQSSFVSAPPDGGFWAWMSVVSGFFIILNTWGVFISFGVFQTYYITVLDRSPSDISWIGSLEIFLLLFTGSLAGVLTDAGYFRITVTVGAVLIVLGTFMTSISKTYWQIFLAQGICTGLGNGLLFTPVMAVISTYFSRRRSIALALAACGSTVGGLIFPSMARTLLPRAGFGWTMRAIGFLQLGTLILALAVIKPRPMSKKGKGPLFDFTAFREAEYSLYAAGTFMTFIGVFFPFFYLSKYAQDIQGLSYSDSLNLVLVLNGVGIVARVFPSIIALWVGTFNVFTTLVATSALMMYCWAAVPSLQGLYIWTVFFSLSMGGIQSLLPAALAALKFDSQKQGTRMGMVFAVIAFGILIGPPICGVLIRNSGGSYLNAQIFSGSCIVAGFVFLVTARETKRRREGLSLLAKI